MRKKVIRVPLYPNKLVMYKCDDLKEIEKLYDLSDCSDYDAIVFESKGLNIVAFSKTITAGIIAHESLHIASDIFNSISADMDLNNQEPQCYLLEWVVEQCHKFLENEK
jgi:hypothetical protein